MIELTPIQQEAVDLAKTSFLLGPVGTGKSTALRGRLLRLLASGEPAYTFLVLVAEPEHESPIIEAVRDSGIGAYTDLKVTTYNQMAREMVSLFWPLVARPAGFKQPFQPPTFLSYDLAQLLMWVTVRPMLDAGVFSTLRLRPQQIVSQLLDTLNRAALNSLGLEQAVDRQIKSWAGDPERLHVLQNAAVAARSFRAACLDNSLLDLSLIVEVFDTQLVRHPEFQRYFHERYRHLIADNVEEQTPAGQNFIHFLLPVVQSGAIAYDAGGGYKRFMAADPLGANQFRSRCHYTLDFTESFVSLPELSHLANVVENYLMQTKSPTADAGRTIKEVVSGRYRREMIANLVPLLGELIDGDGVSPEDIAIITPYLDGALRYSLTQALQQAGLPYRLLRRRTSPRDEPRVRAWISWLALAHPEWNKHPSSYDIAEALTLSIDGMDPARAALVTSNLYRPDAAEMLPVSELLESTIERIGWELLEQVETLRSWLMTHGGTASLDRFLHDLFAQVLSRPPFQPHPNLADASVCDWLVKSAARLRRSAQAMGFKTPAEIGEVFIEGINQGLVTAHPPDLGEPPDPNGISISTIYGFLLAGGPVRYQVWLETAATGWWEIPNQPLSNAFVLAQSRAPDAPWTMEEDFAIRNQLLSRIIRGLVGRCSEGVILVNSDLDRRGLRQDGPLWRSLQFVRQASTPQGG